MIAITVYKSNKTARIVGSDKHIEDIISRCLKSRVDFNIDKYNANSKRLEENGYIIYKSKRYLPVDSRIISEFISII
jgi:hypothetical protein